MNLISRSPRNRPFAAVLLGGLAAAAVALMTACTDSTSGNRTTTESGSHSTSTSQSASTTPTPTGETTSASQPTASQSTSAASGGGTHSQTPASVPAVTLTYNCEVDHYEDLPGLPHTAFYLPTIRWKSSNATGVAISVDNPGVVGSYGTYGPSGSLQLGTGCYTSEGTHVITAYTLGGSPQAHQTLTETGTMTKPSAPPFAASSSPEPLPSASRS